MAGFGDADERGQGLRASGALVALAGLAATLLLVAPTIVLAAIEPGIYFDPKSASPGDRVTMFSAADYPMCWSADAWEYRLEDWAVHLAPAAVASPGDGDLVEVEGTWSEQHGAAFFVFRVPSLDRASYRGYVACADGRLIPSVTTLLIIGVPATDAASAGSPGTSGAPWAIAVVAALGAFIATLRRLRSGRSRS